MNLCVRGMGRIRSTGVASVQPDDLSYLRSIWGLLYTGIVGECYDGPCLYTVAR